MGRPVIYYGELARMNYAEGLVNAYRERERAGDWVAWDAKNTYWARELRKLGKEADGRQRSF
jgi:hypothetical protein